MARALFMRWVDLAFLHWRVSPDQLRPLVPPRLEIDRFDGSAWLGITPFRMTAVRPVAFPPIPTARDFAEINVRTYVRLGARAGVWFFSLDAASRLAVLVARTLAGLPYFHARMDQRSAGDDVRYESVRAGHEAPAAVFRARYRPTGSAFRSVPGSLEHFLTERYSLFSLHAGVLLRVDVEHEPWTLHPASADVEFNTMAAAAGITLSADAPPHALFSRTLDVWARFPAPA